MKKVFTILLVACTLLFCTATVSAKDHYDPGKIPKIEKAATVGKIEAKSFEAVKATFAFDVYQGMPEVYTSAKDADNATNDKAITPIQAYRYLKWRSESYSIADNHYNFRDHYKAVTNRITAYRRSNIWKDIHRRSVSFVEDQLKAGYANSGVWFDVHRRQC